MATNQKTPLPYGTYGMLKSTVERFVKSTVPGSINRHVLDDLSGGDLSALLVGLRFLGLVNEDKSIKPEFRQLVEARKKGEAEYKAALLKHVQIAYKPLIDGLDIGNATLPDLEKRFREYSGFTGQMLTKAIRFYVKALEDSEVKVSEFITKPRPRAPKPRTPKPRKAPGQQTNDEGSVLFSRLPPDEDAVPQDFARLPIPGIEGAFIQYPKNLTETGVLMFEAMISVLRTYAKSKEPRKGSEGRKP